MNSIAERLRIARERAGHATAADAARAFGWAYPTYAGHENGSRGFSRDTAAQYARAFRVAPEWLLFGSSDGEIEHVSPTEAPPAGKHLVTVFDIQASAGFGAVIDAEEPVYSLAFPPQYLARLTRSSPQNLAIISVKGDSMEPTLLDDDIVLLDTSKRDLSYDGLFVLRYGDALHVKRVTRNARPDHVTVLSDNRVYPPVDYRLDEIEPVGKVLWYGRKV